MANETPKRVKLFHTVPKELHEWLTLEKERSGRSMSWMVENAVKQWRDRLEKGRKS